MKVPVKETFGAAAAAARQARDAVREARERLRAFVAQRPARPAVDPERDAAERALAQLSGAEAALQEATQRLAEPAPGGDPGAGGADAS